VTVIVGCCNLIADGDRYLLVRESKASSRQRYNLPAGKLEVGETLVEAAVREAREESGLDVAVEALIGIYQCPETSEGFGVVNFVFASRRIGGTLRTSDEHPEVSWFTRLEIAELASRGLVRGTHIQRAINDRERGVSLPLELVQVVPPSSFPA
jgi:ADP-ribose pyrophosphatase YjhB (NUDIX family)